MTSDKPWYKRWWAITLFIIFGLSILGSLIGGNDSSSNYQPPVIQEEPVVAKQQEVKTFSVGDTIQAGDFKWKILSFNTRKSVGDDYLKQTADGIYLILDVEVENTGKSANLLMDSFVKLIDDQGREFSADSGTAIYLKDSLGFFEQLNPGIKKKGKIVYDVPEGLKVANLRISNNLLESSYYNVKLVL